VENICTDVYSIFRCNKWIAHYLAFLLTLQSSKECRAGISRWFVHEQQSYRRPGCHCYWLERFHYFCRYYCNGCNSWYRDEQPYRIALYHSRLMIEVEYLEATERKHLLPTTPERPHSPLSLILLATIAFAWLWAGGTSWKRYTKGRWYWPDQQRQMTLRCPCAQPSLGIYTMVPRLDIRGVVWPQSDCSIIMTSGTILMMTLFGLSHLPYIPEIIRHRKENRLVPLRMRGDGRGFLQSYKRGI